VVDAENRGERLALEAIVITGVAALVFLTGRWRVALIVLLTLMVFRAAIQLTRPVGPWRLSVNSSGAG
jgi:hypothetical protein